MGAVETAEGREAGVGVATGRGDPQGRGCSRISSGEDGSAGCIAVLSVLPGAARWCRLSPGKGGCGLSGCPASACGARRMPPPLLLAGILGLGQRNRAPSERRASCPRCQPGPASASLHPEAGVGEGAGGTPPPPAPGKDDEFCEHLAGAGRGQGTPRRAGAPWGPAGLAAGQDYDSWEEAAGSGSKSSSLWDVLVSQNGEIEE